MRHLLRRALPAALTVAALVLAGCTGQDDDAERAAPVADTSPLAFTSCDDAPCEGTLDGARYRVLMPRTWNGTLVIYSHGYRFVEPVPPRFTPPATDAVPAPGQDVVDRLLAEGYALAGSSWSSNGWAVQEGVAAAERLYEHVAGEIGRPRRVYLWGDSLGGLVTQVLAEKGRPWVSGAAPLCGVLGGTNDNLDLALDLAFAVRTLVLPSLRLTGYASHQDAVKQWQQAQAALVGTAAGGLEGAATVALVAALLDAPDQTSQFDGRDAVSRVSAAVEAALTGLGYGTYGRYEIEQRVGGNPSTNVGVDYATRITPAERSLIDTVGGSGTTDRLLARLGSAPRLAADPDARSAAAALGAPTGALRVPTVTLHTTDDPLVLVQNQSLLAARASERGRGEDLLQLYVAPPRKYDAPAPYGAGHCNFTSEHRLRALRLLDDWVRSGTRPGPSAVHRAVEGVAGVDERYQPPPWPAAAR